MEILAGKKIRTESCRKGYTQDEDRIISPEKTLDNILDTFKQAGITGKLERMDVVYDKLDIPVHFCSGGEIFKKTGKEGEWGSGASIFQSEVSAVMKCWEKFNWLKSFRKEMYSENRESLASLEKQTIKLDDLLYSSIKLPKDQKELNEVKKTVEKLKMPFTDVFEMFGEKKIEYPYLWYVYNSFSNGLGTGNNLVEALLHGIYEVIEKDCIAKIIQNPKPLPSFKLSSIKDRVNTELIQKFTLSQVKLHVKDISSLPFPTFLAIAEDKQPLSPETALFFSAGTASTKERALTKALTNIAKARTQSLKLKSENQRGFGSTFFFPEEQKKKKQLISTLNKGVEEISFSNIQDFSSDNMLEELEFITRLLQSKGKTVFCRLIEDEGLFPHISNPVVQIIVPGMECLEYRGGEEKKSIYYFIAKILQANNEGREAQKYIDKAQQQDGSKPYITFCKAISHLMLREREKAERALQDCQKSIPDQTLKEFGFFKNTPYTPKLFK